MHSLVQWLKNYNESMLNDLSSFLELKGKLFSDDVINRIKQGPDVEGWDPFDATLVRAVDELYSQNCMTDSTWKILSERFKTNQLIEILFIVGYYNLLALTMNSLGAQVEGMYKLNKE
jgi:alkylhydroperoxidase family enzyme